MTPGKAAVGHKRPIFNPYIQTSKKQRIYDSNEFVPPSMAQPQQEHPIEDNQLSNLKGRPKRQRQSLPMAAVGNKTPAATPKATLKVANTTVELASTAATSTAAASATLKVATTETDLVDYIQSIQKDPALGVAGLTTDQKKHMTTKTGALHNSTDNERRVSSAEQQLVSIVLNSAAADKFLTNALNEWVLPDDDLAY